jgi:LacI family gluconate utilization system Gnt-I transcriptional repressor
MHEVAELAGVSRMTVSRALNHPEKVKEKVRLRVFEAVSQLGYVHNHLARSLSSNRSNVIGLVLPSLENSIFSQTVKAISDVLRPAGFHLMLAEATDDAKVEEAVIAAFISQRVAGLVLHGTQHSPASIRMLKGANIPVVENGDIPTEPIDMVASYSNRAASRAMTLHLARLGYKKIAFASLANNPRAAERQIGFLEALEEAGHKPDPRRMVAVSRGFVGGTEAIAHIEQSAPDTDALFCAGDVIAVGALLECNRRGWDVPGRLAIASYDDLELMRHVNPPITALRLPRHEIGRRSAEMLLARIVDRELPARSADLGFEILQRGST